jgi:4-carboxymuconolactone decarboxylase
MMATAFARLWARGRSPGAPAACSALVLLVTLAPQGPSRPGPRMAPVADSQRTDEQRAIAVQFASVGMPNAVGTYLNHPALAKAILPYEHYVWNDSTLPSRHRDLLNMRTVWLTRSEYLWAHRVAAVRRTGLSNEDLRRVAQGPDAAGWDPFEAAVLRAADELHVDSFVSDATWQALSARYDTNQMIDLVYSAGEVTMEAGAINSLGVEIEADVPERLPAGIPYTVAAKRTNTRLVDKAARIPPLDRREWTPELRQRIDPTGSGRGTSNVFVTFVRNPPADRLRGSISTHILNATTLPVRQRELLLMRIGVLCRSEYEWAAHSRLGRRAGMTDADVARIVAGPERSPGDTVDTALLHATDELYRDDRVTAETWAALSASFNPGQLLDVLIAVGGYRMASMAINSAGVQLDANMADFRFPSSLR